ncbi:MAG: 3-phosphoshikimate 1-carboxyvinyltransferase [Alphaproteobacteria bacterium]|nr:3-phosphoshikimate 1-carboxyvinyltransferase [Alphaproteobacteria bacterium]
MSKHDLSTLCYLRSSPGKKLEGMLKVPGDKSISHRSLIFASQAVGHSTIEGLLEGDDVLRTGDALKKLGAVIERDDDGIWHVDGVGVGGLCEPNDILDLGNSGTGARLLMGLVSSYPFKTFFTGDASLRKRPMKRVSEPLAKMGAVFHARTGGLLPMMVEGAAQPIPIEYTLPVASAQVKSAILLAALNIPGTTSVIEPILTRDHTEKMMRFFGADMTVEDHKPSSGRIISIHGQPELKPQRIRVPGDPSSAAFIIVAALIIPGSDVTIQGVGMNPLRTGLFISLQEMGADITWLNQREEAGEDVADIRVRYSQLKAIEVPAERAPSMIDEYPILSIAAAFANGRTIMKGLHELRVKESDRLTAVAEGLKACQIPHAIQDDTLVVEGTGTPPQGGGKVNTHHDHRIAMSFLVCGMAAQKPVTVDGAEMIQTSFPGFTHLMQTLGAVIDKVDS